MVDRKIEVSGLHPAVIRVAVGEVPLLRNPLAVDFLVLLPDGAAAGLAAADRPARRTDQLCDVLAGQRRDPDDRQEEDEDSADRHPSDLDRRVAEHRWPIDQLRRRPPEIDRRVNYQYEHT